MMKDLINLRLALEQIAEVKRILVAAQYALHDKRRAVMLVTSAERGEGKTLLAAALAETAAREMNHRVAVIDFNWHRPALHRCFELRLERSFLEIMGAELGEIVSPSPGGSSHVLVAPRDHDQLPAPASQVFSGVHRLIDQAREEYDLVFIDGASIFPTNRMMMDPVMLAGLVDGVILIVRAASTARQQVRGAQKTIEAGGGRLLGVVSNRWQGRSND